MKKICLILVVTSAAFGIEPKEGLYRLKGFSPGQTDKPYVGGVSLTKKGDVYLLGWIIAGIQKQIGVGILEGNVLSVGYHDQSGRDQGVVAFKVLSPRKLKGKWSSLGAIQVGTEELEFQSERGK